MAGQELHAANLVGRRLGHFRFMEQVGAGGMGEVYRAHDEHLDREVAIKVLSAGTLADESARRQFRNEALACSKLAHPNIATVYDFDSQDGTDFLVTEYVAGQTLHEMIAAAPLPEEQVLRLGRQLAEGLAAAHEHGIVHRDVKPGNLRLAADGRLKILDFGLARPLPAVRADTPTDTSSSNNMGVAGTLAYMAPEQLRGQAPDPRSDIYSAGVVLYEMTTGRLPFLETVAPALIDSILHQPPTPPRWCRPGVSARLEQIVLKCLEKDPGVRYQSCVELLADFRRAGMPENSWGNSVAVLYFENLGQQQEHEYFRDGITEDITTELSKIRGLRVFSRSAVLGFRDKPVTPAHVGRQLHAAYVLEGSVRREGLRLRLNAKLIETATGHAAWAERYDRQIEDVFAIQDEIAQSIAGALRVVLTETEKRDIAKAPTADVQAYDFYLRGRQFFHQFRRKGFDFAREMFARAIELDQGYARAYAGIADCCFFLHMYWNSTEEMLQQADAASQKALELDPDLAEAHASRGLAASLKRQFDEAHKEFEIAIHLNPHLFEPYYFQARNYYAQGKLEKAVQWFEQASQVLPEDYQAPMLMASALHGLGRANPARAAYERGLLAAEKHLALHPGDSRALYFGANALSQLNQRERSVEWLERAIAVEPEEPQVLYNVACVYALLDEAEKAIDCLQGSMTHGWAQREWMEHDPDLASLRQHPRFRALLQHSSGGGAKLGKSAC
jgi:non-specific serine/threonine protein kinase